MSPELLVMAAPPRAYRRLAPGHRASLMDALKRPALVAIILGTAISIYATRRVTLGLTLSTILCWSFAAAVQAIAAAALVASSKRRSVSIPAGLDLLFMGHGPWSLWLLAVTAWAVWLPVRPAADGGYWILAADFHVHGFPGDGALAPWELRREAMRRGLDQRADRLMAAAPGRRASDPRRTGSDRAGLPCDRGGNPGRDRLAAAGLGRHRRDSRAGRRRDRGAPLRRFWQGFDDAAMTRLDGAEIAHPAGANPGQRADMSTFYERTRERNPRLAPIGSSDYHFSGRVGLCRTYVFAREVSERGVIEAVREGRTVAFDAAGRAYGDPARVGIVEKLRREAGTSVPEFSTWRHVSLALTLIGLSLLTCGTRLQPREG